MATFYSIARNVRRAYDSGDFGEVDPWVLLYRSEGGSVLVATPGKWNDSGEPRDLALILPAYAGKVSGETWMPSRVVTLYPASNPEFIEALRSAFDNED